MFETFNQAALLTSWLRAHILCCMKNITLSMEENVLRLGREYARLHNISFNVLVRNLIEQTVKKNTSNWLDDTFELIDKNTHSSSGITWKRKDLYRG